MDRWLLCVAHRHSMTRAKTKCIKQKLFLNMRKMKLPLCTAGTFRPCAAEGHLSEKGKH
uniref:Uncharacterized protein n=1 Tax=Anguilla anguilla TaxID=7936 RepID=A0A0E9WSJ1_ANGAN